MKLVICTKVQVNRTNCVESRRVRVTIFSRRLLWLMNISDYLRQDVDLCQPRLFSLPCLTCTLPYLTLASIAQQDMKKEQVSVIT